MDRTARRRAIADILNDLETETEHQTQHVHNLMRWYRQMESETWFPLGALAELNLWSNQNLSLLRQKITDLRRLMEDLG